MRITTTMVGLLLIAGCSSGNDDSTSALPPAVAVKAQDVPGVLENRAVREAYDNAFALLDKARTRAEFDRGADLLLEI